MGKIVGLIFQEAVSEQVATPDVFTCPVCGKEYKTEEGLQRHIQDKHPEAGEPQE